MDITEKILSYLKKTYHPLAVIVSGSYADGSFDEGSDFDCTVVVEGEKPFGHDSSVIDGVPLDCFIYTDEEAEDIDPDAVLPIFNGRIIFDTDGIAANMKAKVAKYVADNTVTSESDKQIIRGFIVKCMKRMDKNDDDGNYRLISLLWESLCDYFLLRDMYFFGGKKAIKYLKENDPEGYGLYHKAITEKTPEAVKPWAEYILKV